MLEVRTGCRLHFGLMELCQGEPQCFGGLGLMLDRPGYTIRMSGESETCHVELRMPAEYRQRANQSLQRHLMFNPQGHIPAKIELTEALPLHIGLGSGTQLASAISMGLEFYQQRKRQNFQTGLWHECHTAIRPDSTPEEWLAERSGRGLRSAIGLRGFLTGGLILDDGYNTSQTSPRRVNVSSRSVAKEWRVVTVRPISEGSISGQQESKLLDEIGRYPNPNRIEMQEVAATVMQTCEDAANFDRFTAALERYMSLAAEIFRTGQGGIYNGQQISAAVAIAQQAGLQAVGQSSWGPTVFGFAPNQALAETARDQISRVFLSPTSDVQICTPSRTGACFQLITEIPAP